MAGQTLTKILYPRACSPELLQRPSCTGAALLSGTAAAAVPAAAGAFAGMPAAAAAVDVAVAAVVAAAESLMPADGNIIRFGRYVG